MKVANTIAVITAAFTITTAFIWTEVVVITLKPHYVAEVVPDNIKRAIYKMGPKYKYKLNGTELYVDKGDGRWLRLQYEGR
jgi:hypothetical protein